ncbi:hypothetical protein EYF80_006787 [Liparis tanakae]|uniref:Uncharacterized protein n=1 Tax=Liparis tanakae TaxID=230148 RepID=A0A4Z2IXW2_9TELE|nr:hypothetical protein EYF80_006787 [Liparis tanakae]
MQWKASMTAHTSTSTPISILHIFKAQVHSLWTQGSATYPLPIVVLLPATAQAKAAPTRTCSATPSPVTALQFKPTRNKHNNIVAQHSRGKASERQRRLLTVGHPRYMSNSNAAVELQRSRVLSLHAAAAVTSLRCGSVGPGESCWAHGEARTSYECDRTTFALPIIDHAVNPETRGLTAQIPPEPRPDEALNMCARAAVLCPH